MAKMNILELEFMGIKDPVEKALLMQAMLLMDLEYFPAQNDG